MEHTDLLIVGILTAFSIAAALAALLVRLSLKSPSGPTDKDVELFDSYHFPEPKSTYVNERSVAVRATSIAKRIKHVTRDPSSPHVRTLKKGAHRV